MLTLNDICKSYFTDEIETRALRNVSFTVEEGEFVAIMGPSGCGKSTLLNVLGMLDRPNSGSYLLDERDTTHLTERQRVEIRKRHIGFVFQSFNLIDDLTVYENVELPLLYQRLNLAERRNRVTAALERMDVSARRKHFPRQLSGGQQQRVAVARAVAINPTVILADEPTGNLDTSNGNVVMELLKELNDDGSTIIMVTHTESHATKASRLIRLLDGQVISDGSTE